MERIPYNNESFTETRRQRNRRIIKERIDAERRRLAIMLELSHRAVSLSLRAEQNQQVRATVRGQLERQYGIKTPTWRTGFNFDSALWPNP